MIIIKSDQEIELMRESGKVTGTILKELEDFVNEKRELMLQLENLQREKLEIDAKIKAYSEQLYRRT